MALSGYERRKQRTRLSILDHALDCFEEFGYSNTSINMIRERFGGSKSTLYTYFKTKEDILVGLVETKSTQFQLALTQYIRSIEQEDKGEWLKEAAAGYRNLIDEYSLWKLLNYFSLDSTIVNQNNTFLLFILTQEPAKIMHNQYRKAFKEKIDPEVFSNFVKFISQGWIFRKWVEMPDSQSEVTLAIEVFKQELERIKNEN